MPVPDTVLRARLDAYTRKLVALTCGALEAGTTAETAAGIKLTLKPAIWAERDRLFRLLCLTPSHGAAQS